VFTTQDLVRQVVFGLGWEQARAPWSPTLPTPARLPTPFLNPTVLINQIPRSSETLEHLLTPSVAATEAPTFTPTPEVTRTLTEPPLFRLAGLQVSGSLEGEGVWQPYLYDSTGRPLALRTFFQPDPKRAYAILSVVAFDLRYTRLHFVLGYAEPHTGKYRLSGSILPEDIVDSRLLAAFNGGFLPVHGGYGAMADGITPIQPRAGLATVAIDREGRVSLGEWGSTIQDSAEWEAWRQNGPLIIADGQVTKAVENGSVAVWGGTIEGDTITWRSAIGLSRDHQVLYYAAGPGMAISTLADGLRIVGVDAAMQLDINPSWTHFVAVRYENGTPLPVPLLKEMVVNPGRYLEPCARDFFYVSKR